MAEHTFAVLRRRLRELPRTVAKSVAARAAPMLTDKTQAAYGSGVDVYGVARPVSEVDGAPLDLHRSGDARKFLKFVTDGGTQVRVHLGTPYTKYLIGKYRILPNGALPVSWRAAIDVLTQTTKAPP